MEIRPHCLLCGKPVPCKVHGDRYSAISFASHEGLARDLVLEMKYCGNALLGREIGRVMARNMKRPGGDNWYIVPVPLHLFSNRGYNQAREIAEGISSSWFFPVLDRLTWTELEKGQSRSSWKERGDLPADSVKWTGKELAGCNIILVDDVRTTGVTLTVCSKALYRAKAKRVSSLTWTRSLHR